MLEKYLKLVKRNKIWESKISLLIISFGILVNLSIWILFYYLVEPNKYPIPLHYNIYTGIDIIDYWYKIFVIPAFGLFLLLINIIIGIYYMSKEKFISYVLFVGGLLVQIILLISGIVLTHEL